MRLTVVPGVGSIVDLPYVPTLCVEALDDLERSWPGATDPDFRVYVAAAVLLAYADFEAKRLVGIEQEWLTKADGTLVPKDCVVALEVLESTCMRGTTFDGARLAIVDKILVAMAESDEIGEPSGE